MGIGPIFLVISPFSGGTLSTWRMVPHPGWVHLRDSQQIRIQLVDFKQIHMTLDGFNQIHINLDGF